MSMQMFLLQVAAVIALASAHISPLHRQANNRDVSTYPMLSEDDYEEVLSAIQHELFVHSPSKMYSEDRRSCLEILDANATMIKSIGKNARALVDVVPDRKFLVGYCSQEGNGICGTDSSCSTVYRWRKATVRREVMPDSEFQFNMVDRILVPQGCTCVISPHRLGLKHNSPIILND